MHVKDGFFVVLAAEKDTVEERSVGRRKREKTKEKQGRKGLESGCNNLNFNYKWLSDLPSTHHTACRRC